jgi:glycosyltransferase involved in cell wall biosynthesis
MVMIPITDRPSNPIRVLLIAEACNPTWTSVPLVGYNIARALSARPDLQVTLVSHVRNRSALQADPLAAQTSIHYIDNEWLASPLHKVATMVRGGQSLSWTIETAMAWPSYVVFENTIARQFSRQLAMGAFDLIHRLTPLTPTMGSPLASLTEIPMLIGPLNGGLPWPKEYPDLRHQEREWLVPLRGLYRKLPYFSSTYRRLAGVIAGSRHTMQEVPRTFRGKRFYLPENGVDPARFPLASGWPTPQGRFRFITASRLVPYKGVDLTLEAMSSSPDLKACELFILGDGPERNRLETLTKQYGLESTVRFLGHVDQSRMANEFASSQAFVFPSLREFGGGVVLEAMGSGLPAIVVDYGGPGELVTPECGVLLPMAPRAELVGKLRQAMEGLVRDAARCKQQGEAASQRIQDEFTWSAKAGRIVSMYREVLAARQRGSR